MPRKIVFYTLLSLFIAAAATAASYVQESWPLKFSIIFIGLIVGLLIVEAITMSDDVPTAPTRTSQPDLPVGFGRALIEKLPTPLVVIEERGLITYANPAATALLPRIRTGDHFANPFRAPRFVEAVTGVFEDGREREIVFEMSGQDLLFEALMALLPPGGDLGYERQVIVKIEDRTEARRTDEMRKDFIANASHELRTPLASIIGYIETLQNHAKDDPDAQARFLGIMDKQASRMRRIIDDLMSLSRIEMKSHIAPSEQIEIHRLVQESVAAFQPVARKSGMSFEVALDLDGGPVVQGDRDELTQVTANLIDNAMKYGGAAAPIRVESAQDNPKYPGMAGISVADKGPGISRDNLHRVTERFYRVNSGGGQDTAGTGLGLAIVKHVMNRHGGALQIESTPGRGSTFTFWLPTMDAASSESRNAEQKEKAI